MVNRKHDRNSYASTESLVQTSLTRHSFTTRKILQYHQPDDYIFVMGSTSQCNEFT